MGKNIKHGLSDYGNKGTIGFASHVGSDTILIATDSRGSVRDPVTGKITESWDIYRKVHCFGNNFIVMAGSRCVVALVLAVVERTYNPATGLRKFFDTVKNAIRELEEMNIKVKADFILGSVAIEKNKFRDNYFFEILNDGSIQKPEFAAIGCGKPCIAAEWLNKEKWKDVDIDTAEKSVIQAVCQAIMTSDGCGGPVEVIRLRVIPNPKANGPPYVVDEFSYLDSPTVLCAKHGILPDFKHKLEPKDDMKELCSGRSVYDQDGLFTQINPSGKEDYIILRRGDPPPSGPPYLQFWKTAASTYRREHDLIVRKGFDKDTQDIEVPVPIMNFKSSGFSPEIIKKLSASCRLAIPIPVYPTPIQAQTWPIVLQGRDIVVVSTSGSERTLAYLVPVCQLIKDFRSLYPSKPPSLAPKVLVLVLSQELALQVRDVVKDSFQGFPISCACFYGDQE